KKRVTFRSQFLLSLLYQKSERFKLILAHVNSIITHPRHLNEWFPTLTFKIEKSPGHETASTTKSNLGILVFHLVKHLAFHHKHRLYKPVKFICIERYNLGCSSSVFHNELTLQADGAHSGIIH